MARPTGSLELRAGVSVVGGDLFGLSADATVTAVQGDAISTNNPNIGETLIWDGDEYVPTPPGFSAIDYTTTIWVDPNGSALVNGRNPQDPTTLTNALATAASGSTIILGAATYALSPTVATAGLTLVGASVDGSTSPTPSVRITGLLTVSTANTRIVGIDLASGLTDSSAAAGTTRLAGCSVGAITIDAPAAGQTLALARSSYISASITGASGGLTLSIEDASGGSISHAGTGSVSISARNANIGTVTNASTGSTSLTAVSTTLAGVVWTAGTISGVTLASCIVGSIASPGTVDATGAGAGTVAFIDTVLDRAASTIPTGAELLTTLVEHSSPVRGSSFLARNRFLYVNPVPAPNNSPTPAVHLLASPDLPTSGFYRIDVFIRLSGSASGTEIAADFTVDGVSAGTGAFLQTNVAGGIYPFGGPFEQFFTAGVHNIATRFWQPAGPGTLTAQVSVIIIYRIG